MPNSRTAEHYGHHANSLAPIQPTALKNEIENEHRDKALDCNQETIELLLLIDDEMMDVQTKQTSKRKNEERLDVSPDKKRTTKGYQGRVRHVTE